MTAAVAEGLRIGEVARMVGTTTRTVRYYEEIGLLTASDSREAGRHRVYTQKDVDRLRDALRLKSLLGVSLDELRELLEAEEARDALREEWRHGDPTPARRREILEEYLHHLDRQLELARQRLDDVRRLERDLVERRERTLARLAQS